MILLSCGGHPSSTMASTSMRSSRWRGARAIGGLQRRPPASCEIDGAPIWTYPAAGGIDSSPVIAGDRVLFGSQDGRITMLRFDTGEKIWSYLVGSPVRAAVAVVDGWIIAVAVDGGVYAFGEAP